MIARSMLLQPAPAYVLKTDHLKIKVEGRVQAYRDIDFVP